MNNKLKGYFKYTLVLDCETSGIAFGADDPSFDPKQNLPYQSVSWGLIVVESHTLKTVEEMYVEIMWDSVSLWQTDAENIHKLSKDHLTKNGLTQEEVVEEIGGLLLKYWGPDNAIPTIGHNVGSFDIFFLRRLFRKFGIELKFSHRQCDTNSVGFATFGTYSSDELFQALELPPRKTHNALEDARMALEVVKRVRKLWRTCILDE
ncbi:MAG: 3'-5' exonuclease [Nitrosopumilaceae archaeon]